MKTYINGTLTRTTKVEQLLIVLSDGQGHATQELVRRVGHTFGGAKRKLIAAGYVIERESHPGKRFQHLYRLLDGPAD